jgi:hypothetical protein
MQKTRILSVAILFSLLLSACQAAAPLPAVLPTWTVVPLPALSAASLESTPAPASPNKIAPMRTEPSTAEVDPAAATARAYFQALEAGDFQTAANLITNYSLMMAGMTRGEAVLELQGELARGSRWSALEVIETRPFDDHTRLVHVTYRLEGKDAKTGQATRAQPDELWPMRLENGRWLYNRANLIDYRVLDVPEQATGGLIVKPRLLTRFSDRIRLTLMVQNTTNEAIVLGQVNAILAVFQFQDQQVEAVKTQMIFDRLRTNPQAAIEAQGLYAAFPDSVVIRKWKNYKVKPWFTFELTE